MDVGGLFALAGSEGVVGLDSGAAANVVCSSWLGRHGRSLPREGLLRGPKYPASALFRFGNGRLEGARQAADVPVGVAGN